MFAALDAELEKRKNAKDGGGSCATCGAAEGETCGESSSSSSSATATRTASASFTSLEYLLFGGIALGVPRRRLRRDLAVAAVDDDDGMTRAIDLPRQRAL